MSIPVPVERLREALAERGNAGYLLTVSDELRPHAVSALEEVFDLTFDELPAEDGAGLWPQPLHERLTAKPTGATSSGTAQGVEQVAAR